MRFLRQEKPTQMKLVRSKFNLGSQHPAPESIPHSIPQNLKKNDLTNSPVKESGLHSTEQLAGE
jgi:hypothetical protein